MSAALFKLGRVLCLAVANVLAILGILAAQPPGSEATPALVESPYLYVPPTAVGSGPVQVVVAVHGLGGNGKLFGSQLIEQANHNGWVIVAPTIHYGNWWNLDELVREDTAFSQWLVGYLDNLQRDTGVVPRERVLLFGFSRGAGVIGRFAVLHPGRVLAGVALSSSAYTLPAARDEKGRTLVFPFGVADLAAHGGRPFEAREFAKTRWFVGVGESDDEPKAVPQVWTPFIGATRVERAKRFSAALRSAGAGVTLRIFPETRHLLTPEMRNESLSFLRDAEPVRSATGENPGAGSAVIATPIPVVGEHYTPTHTPAAAAVVPTPTPHPPLDHRPPVVVEDIPQSRPAALDAVTPPPHAPQAEPVSPPQYTPQSEVVSPPPQHTPAQADAGVNAAQAVPADGAPSPQPEAPSAGAPVTDAPTDDPASPPAAEEQVPDPSPLPPA